MTEDLRGTGRVPSAGEGPDIRSGEVAKLRRRLRAVERELELREAEIQLLRSSHSFRLTAPLRMLRRMLSSGREDALGLILRAGSTDGTGEPALAGLPRHVFATAERPAGPNDSHRPLDLDAAIQPLLRAEIRDGRLSDGVGPGAPRYHGCQPNPLRIATITSRELREELSFDAEVTPLLAGQWSQQLDPARHDLVLLESAWEPEGEWGVGFPGGDHSRSLLGKLIARCRELSLPVVLWAREDATQLDRVGWLASQVDRAYAIDLAGKAALERAAPRLGCGILPPAVQPALYNPIRSYGLRDCEPALGDKLLYDGWWDISGDAVQSALASQDPQRLRIVDSRWDYSRIRLQDSPQHAGQAMGVLSPLEKSALLRNMRAEMFVSGSIARPWQLATQMLRAAASGAAALWTGPAGEAPWNGPAVLPALPEDPLETRRLSHLAFRDVMTRHCLGDRLQQITRDLGLEIPVVEAPARVAHLLVTMRPELLEACLQRFRMDAYPQRELVVVLHGDHVDIAAARALVKPGEAVSILAAARERSLGDCLNQAIGETDAPFWMKLDDDDCYGPQYTSDMMLYRRVIDAPLMGKPPMFLYLEQGNELRWDPVWASHANLLHQADVADSALVAGGTLAGRREVLETVRFSSARRGGSDSDFIRRAHEQGHDLLAVDGFNFARFRSGRAGFHTWQADDEALRRRSKLTGNGGAIQSHVYI